MVNTCLATSCQARASDEAGARHSPWHRVRQAEASCRRDERDARLLSVPTGGLIMVERVEFGLPVGSLAGAVGPASRMAYSYWFAPLDNEGSNGRPVLTRAQFAYVAMAAGLSGDPENLWRMWHSPDADGNGSEPLRWVGSAAARRFRRATGERAADNGGNAFSLTSALGLSTHGDDDTDPFATVVERPTGDVLLELLRSEVGLLFLDRTRIVPAGFVVGDHIYTLGLGPGEEATLEQRSFVQEERSTEDMTESEGTTETEDAASWTFDSADTIVGTGTDTSTDGFTAGGSVGFEYGVKVGVQGQYSDGTSSADTDSRTTSTKAVNAGTTKNLAKARDLHKTIFRLSSLQRFESSARRVLRNPNPHTPIDLHMFKVLQRVKFAHERYGVRLCWSPFVKDPAGDFFAAEDQMRMSLLEQAEKAIPKAVIPLEQIPSGVSGAEVVGLDPPMVELAAWGGWPGSDMSHDYTLPINVPANMKWDGDVSFVHNSLQHILSGADRGYSVECIGDPWEVVGSGSRTIFQVVHAGATWRLTGHSQIYVSLSARVIPDGTSLSQEQAKAHAEWEASSKRLLAEREAKAAEARELAMVRFAEWQADHQKTLDPAQELTRRFVNAMFPADARDEIAELDFWEQAFDWSLASARTYAGTWSGSGLLRDPTRPAADFVNASWARLYLPIRPGFEEPALRWIYLRARAGNGPTCINELIEAVTKDLEQWRIDNLGGREEITVTPVSSQPCPDVTQRFICLGTWSDDVPTDGVHIEVTQSPTTAADAIGAGITQAALDRAAAEAAAATADGDVRRALAAVGLSDVTVQVHLDRPTD